MNTLKLQNWSDDSVYLSKRFTPAGNAVTVETVDGIFGRHGKRTLPITEARQLWARLVKDGWQPAQ